MSGIRSADAPISGCNRTSARTPGRKSMAVSSIRTISDRALRAVSSPPISADVTHGSRTEPRSRRAWNGRLRKPRLPAFRPIFRRRRACSLSQDLENRIRLYGGASLADLNFQDSSRSDEVTNLWIGARKYLTPRFYVGAEAGFEERDSSDPAEDYTATQDHGPRRHRFRSRLRSRKGSRARAKPLPASMSARAAPSITSAR